MTILVTGSAGHLGEAILRTLQSSGKRAIGVDIKASPFTTHMGTIADRDFVKKAMSGVEAVIHTATLHKPHVATHSRQDFVDTNITGTLNLLEEAAAQGLQRFVFTSTTSVFGNALVPPPGAPAAWITEDVRPIPKNIYGVTKSAAEDLCELMHKKLRLPCLVLRTSRFFPEEDDNKAKRDAFADDNAKSSEFLFRRVDVEDAVSAHLNAMERAPRLGFGKYIISATSPFQQEDLPLLQLDAPAVVEKYVPAYRAEYDKRHWRMFPTIDRVYVNKKARRDLDWQPKLDFHAVIERLSAGESWRSPLAQLIGLKGYHDQIFEDGPYPVEDR